MEIKKMLCDKFDERPMDTKRNFIVIHYFGDLGTAENTAKYMLTGTRKASAHLIADEGNIVYQAVEFWNNAWHCGTTGEYKHDECRNSNSIGIELRPNKIDKTDTSSASDTDWYFDEATLRNGVVLTAKLMKHYDIPIDNVLRHYDVTGKLCPRPFVGEDKNEYYNISGEYMWQLFKKMVVEEIERDEAEDIVDTLETYYRKLPVSEWAHNSCRKAAMTPYFNATVDPNMIDYPRKPLTREEFCVVLDRMGLLDLAHDQVESDK